MAVTASLAFAARSLLPKAVLMVVMVVEAAM